MAGAIRSELQKIFVGDIQGCGDEFDELLARARAAYADEFELWLVGDLVNRGPHSLRVLERVRELQAAGRARVVLGNHELGLLQSRFELRRLARGDTMREVLESSDADDWIEWLRRQPVALTCRLGSSPFALVHAGVHPDWSLEELEGAVASVHARLGGDDRDECVRLLSAVRMPDHGADRDADVLGRLTRCRSVAGERWSSELPGGGAQRIAWHEAWRARSHGYGIVYGHWALQGLHVERGLRGLDTGCVHHGRSGDGFLSAWLPAENRETEEKAAPAGDASAFELPDDRFWHIPARRRYLAIV